MLDILKEIDRICKKHDIQYFLGYGSCLGAVRHKGFIPWDDDIDLLMKTDDYLRFIEVCKEEMGDKYYLQNRLDDAKPYVFWLQFGVKNSTSINLSMSHIHKPWGICVDIFPLFPYTKNPSVQKARQKVFKQMKLLSLKYYHIGTIKKASLVEKCKKSFHYLLPDNLNLKLFKKLFMELCNPDGMDAECLTTYDNLRDDEYFLSEWFDGTEAVDFEDMKVPCPVDYDAYLTMNYGDYMQIPKNKVKHSDNPDVLIKFNECYENYWS